MENVKDGGSGQMSKTIAIAGTFDTKGKEFLYVKGLAEELGITPYMIHTGVFAPAFEVDVTNMEVAEAAGYCEKERPCIGNRSSVKRNGDFNSEIVSGR